MNPAARSRAREAGFTLIELLIALVLFLAVSAMLYASIQLSQRTSRAQSERAVLQGNLRAAAQALASELGELQVNTGLATTDIAAMTDSSITYRSMRLSGVTCAVGSSEVVVRRSNGLLSSSRGVTPGRDSLLLFADTDTLLTSDDQWVALPVTNPPSAVTCPDGSSAFRIQTNGVPVANVLVPGPVRTFEVMQLAVMRAGGFAWVGARSASAGQPLRPFVGPIDSTVGMRLRYLNPAGSATTLPAAVRQIDVMVRGATRTPVNEGLAPGPGTVKSDSLRFRITVRNSS